MPERRQGSPSCGVQYTVRTAAVLREHAKTAYLDSLDIIETYLPGGSNHAFPKNYEDAAHDGDAAQIELSRRHLRMVLLP